MKPRADEICERCGEDESPTHVTTDLNRWLCAECGDLYQEERHKFDANFIHLYKSTLSQKIYLVIKKIAKLDFEKAANPVNYAEMRDVLLWLYQLAEKVEKLEVERTCNE